jgi:4-hydroxy-tetrahydrodipicolinate synthase
LEIGIFEARALKPNALIEACSASTNILETVELTRHSAEAGADICYLIPPYFEAKGYGPTRLLFQYVTERTDVALGLFNTHAGGWFLSPQECAALVEEFPSICAVKNGMFRPSHTAKLHRLCPDLVIWECDMMAYRAGYLRAGVAVPGILAGATYLFEIPGDQLYTQHWNLIMEDKLSEAITFWYESGLDDLVSSLHENFGPANMGGSPYTHWGSVFKAAAAELGLPPGEYPYSRVPQEPVPDNIREGIRSAYEKIGYIDSPR